MEGGPSKRHLGQTHNRGHSSPVLDLHNTFDASVLSAQHAFITALFEVDIANKAKKCKIKMTSSLSDTGDSQRDSRESIRANHSQL